MRRKKTEIESKTFTRGLDYILCIFPANRMAMAMALFGTRRQFAIFIIEYRRERSQPRFLHTNRISLDEKIYSGSHSHHFLHLTFPRANHIVLPIHCAISTSIFLDILHLCFFIIPSIFFFHALLASLLYNSISTSPNTSRRTTFIPSLNWIKKRSF